ncbi:Circadian clock protein kinase KaiC [Planctomycetales bacterium 10988]|nr:Circadian clock protein kinase KaiC [Planctomycetales bacterium 10988]
MNPPKRPDLEQRPTGIPGLDTILRGGLPGLSINIVFGQPGTGKTIFAYQYIHANAGENCKALYLGTLSEPSVKMLYHLQKFNFVDLEKIGQEVIHLDISEVLRNKGMEGSLEYILDLVREHQPQIIAIDSFKAVHDLGTSVLQSRDFGYHLAAQLSAWGVTLMLIGEYDEEAVGTEPIFAIADGIIHLRNQRHGMHNQRYVDVVKMRGTDFLNGSHPFTISEDGLHVYPRIRTSGEIPKYDYKLNRISTGIAEVDAMLEGGIPRGTTTMIAGSAGTGKTLFGLHFITGGLNLEEPEPGVIVSFQESPAQLNTIASTFGWDLQKLEEEDLLYQLHRSPVEIQPDVHFARVRTEVARIGAKRVLIDSVKDLEIATPDKVRYRDYLYSLVSEFKREGITTIVTNEIPELFGSFQLSEYGVSFIADNVLLLRYVESTGRMGRAMSVLKVRGSQHSKAIWSFEIDPEGIRILEPMQALTGVLTGTPVGTQPVGQKHLPLRSQYLLDLLKREGACSFDTLSKSTGMREEELRQELLNLREQGLVISLTKLGDEVYKPTV